MPTDGKCSRCGFKAPLICFVDAAENGQFLMVFAQLPEAIQKHYLKYLSLFKPASGCSMQSSKADRVTREFLALVVTGYVSEKGKVDRPCPAAIWAMAMERMQEQAATLNLPMKSHGYLKTIAWQLADQADAQQEKKVRQNELPGAHKVRQSTGDDMSDTSEIMRKYNEMYGDPNAAK